MKVKAYAKINLGLDVVRRMDNGYHELNMIMVPVDLYDTIDISFSNEMIIKTNKPYIPTDEKNSVVKVINKLREKYDFNDQFSINLNKIIPSQAGLGGGSADAAIMIKTLNGLLNLNMDYQQQIEFGKSIGADVPFCLVNKPAFVSGIGENIEPFEIDCPFYILLYKPKMGVSTKAAFEMLDFETLNHPDIRGIQKCLETNDYDNLVKLLDNSLEQSALKLVPQIAKVKSKLIDYGFDCAVMSGSGSTVFALTRDYNLVSKAEIELRNRNNFVKKVKIVKI